MTCYIKMADVERKRKYHCCCFLIFFRLVPVRVYDVNKLFVWQHVIVCKIAASVASCVCDARNERERQGRRHSACKETCIFFFF